MTSPKNRASQEPRAKTSSSPVVRSSSSLSSLLDHRREGEATQLRNASLHLNEAQALDAQALDAQALNTQALEAQALKERALGARGLEQRGFKPDVHASARVTHLSPGREGQPSSKARHKPFQAPQASQSPFACSPEAEATRLPPGPQKPASGRARLRLYGSWAMNRRVHPEATERLERIFGAPPEVLSRVREGGGERRVEELVFPLRGDGHADRVWDDLNAMDEIVRRVVFHTPRSGTRTYERRRTADGREDLVEAAPRVPRFHAPTVLQELPLGGTRALQRARGTAKPTPLLPGQRFLSGG